MRRVSAALVSRYARSLFQAAIGQNALEAVHADLAELSEVWRGHREFALLVMNPRLSRERASALLNSLIDRIQAHVLTKSFVHLLIEKDRLEILQDVGLHFERLWRDYKNEIQVSVVTAQPIGEDVKARIQDHVALRSGKTPRVLWREDQAILGGIVIEWPDRIFDGSLARKLDNLTEHLSQTAVPSAEQAAK